MRMVRKKKFIFRQSFFFIFIVLMAGYILLKSPFFVISKIDVQGNNNLNVEEIVKISGIVTGMNIFKADMQTAAEKINTLSMIKEVNMERKLPDTVLIQIKERVPVALVVTDECFLELDAQGYYLREGSVATAGLPVITGIQIQVSKPGALVKGTGLDIALQVVQKLPPQLCERLSEVHVTEDGMIVLYTLEGIECHLGTSEDVFVKGSYFLQVLTELQDEGKRIEYVDFSIIGSPVVKYED